MKDSILVIYVGVAGIRSEDISEYTTKLAHKIVPETFRGEVIVIPKQSEHTTIEYINPEYITDDVLIKKHTELMNKLQYELHNQLKQLKIRNNE